MREPAAPNSVDVAGVRVAAEKLETNARGRQRAGAGLPYVPADCA